VVHPTLKNVNENSKKTPLLLLLVSDLNDFVMSIEGDPYGLKFHRRLAGPKTGILLGI